MATLYEIDTAILDCIDVETGEVIDFEKLEALNFERDKKCENIALWIKNLLSDAEQIKAEKNALAEREKKAKKKAEDLMNYLTYALDGVKFITPKVEVSFRSSEKVEITDEETLIKELQKKGRDDLLTYSQPTVDKRKLKAFIKSGEELSGAYIKKNNNIQIK